MSGADVFIGFQPYVHYFIGSQEVELGTGYHYDILIEPLIKDKMKCDARFARHFVSAFKEAYGKITQDYTHAAIDLSTIHDLERSIDKLGALLIKGLEQQKGKTVKESIKASRHKKHCTRFNEPSYIDFGHFCTNLQKNCSKCELKDASETSAFKRDLHEVLEQH